MNHRDKPNNSLNTVVLVLLVLLLIISWSARNTTRSLQQQVQLLQGELGNLRHQVSHEVGRIQGTVQSMHDEARWYMVPRVDIAGVEGDKARVKVNWNLREYAQGSGVTLNYRYGEHASFRSVEAVEEANGLFAAELVLEIPREPAWSFSVSKAPSQATAGRKLSNVAVMEQQHWGMGSSRMSLEYYITLQEGETTRSSERYFMDLEKLSFSLFNPLDFFMSWESDRALHVMLHQVPAGEPYYKLQTAALESRRGKTETLERWPLNQVEIQVPAGAPAPQYTPSFEARVVPDQAYDSLFLVVHYSGGISVEKEITHLQ